MFLPNINILCDILRNRRTATWNLIVLYNRETKYYSFFISKSFIITWKPALAPFVNTKKPFDVICCLYEVKQSHCVFPENIHTPPRMVVQFQPPHPPGISIPEGLWWTPPTPQDFPVFFLSLFLSLNKFLALYA